MGPGESLGLAACETIVAAHILSVSCLPQRGESSYLIPVSLMTDYRFRSGNERDKEPESEIIKDSPDSPEPVPAVKRPRLVPEESKILDKRKGITVLLAFSLGGQR